VAYLAVPAMRRELSVWRPAIPLALAIGLVFAYPWFARGQVNLAPNGFPFLLARL